MNLNKFSRGAPPASCENNDHRACRSIGSQALIAAALVVQGAGSAALLLLPQFDHLGHFTVLGTSALFLLFSAPLVALAWSRLPTADVLRALPFMWWALVVASLVPVALAEAALGGCRDPIGAADFLLSTGAGVGIGLAFAAGVSRLARPWGVALAWAAFVAVTLAWSLAPLYAGPQVFVLHLVAGYFPGPIYDRLFELPPAFLLDRGVGLVAALAVVQALRGSAERSRGRLALAGALGLLVIGAQGAGASLGLRVDDAALAGALPAERRWQGLTARFDPRRTRPAQLEAAWDDVRFAYDDARSALGQAEAQATLYVFPSDDARGRLLGSRRVSVTKPWRRAAYLSLGSWDTCTVKHELLHVLLDAHTGGWLGLPWTAGLPNLGLVEGSAEALTACAQRFPVHWQARRMLNEAALPAPADLVSPALFWSLPGRRAYAAAASFFGFLIETRGVGAVLGAYDSGDVEGAVGVPLATLATDWRAWLEHAVTLEPEDEALLAEYLSQRSIFSERCSQERARAVAQVPALAACGAWGDVRKALDRADRVAGEPVDPLLRVRALVAEGRRADAEAEVDALLGHEPPLPLSFWAGLARADLDALAGRRDAAREAWTALHEGVRDEALKRQVAVRLLAADGGVLAVADLADTVLFPVGGRRGARAWRALEAAAGRDPLAAYLAARRHLGALRVERALGLLRPVLGVPTCLDRYPEVRREALRTVALAAYRAQDYGLASQVWTDLREEADRPSERRLPEEWLKRISRRRAWR